MRENPCKDCENKGCGSYHDICERYQRWKNEGKTQELLAKDQQWEYLRGGSANRTGKYMEV